MSVERGERTVTCWRQEGQLRVGWLPPIPVNVIDSNSLVPTMHKIMNDDGALRGQGSRRTWRCAKRRKITRLLSNLPEQVPDNPLPDAKGR
jgi:hypothetical protein